MEKSSQSAFHKAITKTNKRHGLLPSSLRSGRSATSSTSIAEQSACFVAFFLIRHCLWNRRGCQLLGDSFAIMNLLLFVETMQVLYRLLIHGSRALVTDDEDAFLYAKPIRVSQFICRIIAPSSIHDKSILVLSGLYS